MSASELLSSLCQAIQDGQILLGNMNRHRLHQGYPAVLERLNFESDEPFLEPLLFAYFSAPPSNEATLDQIVYGYTERNQQREIEVRSDRHGHIHIPRIGLFITKRPHGIFTLEERANTDAVIWNCDGPIPFSYNPEERLARDLILGRSIPESLVHCLRGEELPPYSLSALRSELVLALEVVRQVWPEYSKIISEVVKRIILFEAPNLNSFATIAAHGAVFINAGPCSSASFFVEEIAHQCGHVIFSAATLDQQRYFSVLPNSPIGEFIGEMRDTRTVYTVLHGIFTEAMMIECLNRVIEHGAFDGELLMETVGRLVYILKRAERDLAYLWKAGIFSAEGNELYIRIRTTVEPALVGRRVLCSKFDVHNQPYTFDKGRFFSDNQAALALLSPAR